jgi:hypothetical protein
MPSSTPSLHPHIVTPRTELQPCAGSPWLDNPFPAKIGKRCVLFGLGAVVVGAIGGGQGMLPPVAALFMLAGVVVLLGGLVQWSNGVLQQRTTQVCPACLASMSRGATTCPMCRFTPRQEAACVD